MSRIEMADLVTLERIIPALNATDKHQVVEKLSAPIAATTGLRKELVRRRTLTGEGLTSFGVGSGIAIPHAMLPGVAKPVAAFARLTRPIDFGAADGRDADLIILLVAPENNAALLLRALSCIARRLRDTEVTNRLRGEITAAAAYAILTTDSWRDRDPNAATKTAA